MGKEENLVVKKTIGSKLKKLREGRNETQEHLDDTFDFDYGTICKIEHGRRSIHINELINFARHFNVSPSYLCGQNDGQHYYNENSISGEETSRTRIIGLRKAAHLSQRELDKRLGFKNNHVINAIENGSRQIKATDLYVIANYFGVSISYLCGETDSPEL